MSVFQEIIDSPLSSPEQREKAAKMLDAAKAKTEPQEITGNFTLSDGPIHQRQDKSQYQCKSLVISAEFAKELQRRFGTLFDGKAVEEAAGLRLQAACDPTTDKTDFLKKFPDSLSFWNECQAKLKAFYNEIDAAYPPKGKEQPLTETPETQPAPVTTETIPAAPVMSAADRLLALKNLLGRVN